MYFGRAAAETKMIHCIDLTNGNPCMLEIKYAAFVRIKHTINHPKLNLIQMVIRLYQIVILKQKQQKLIVELDNRKYSVFVDDKIWKEESSKNEIRNCGIHRTSRYPERN